MATVRFKSGGFKTFKAVAFTKEAAIKKVSLKLASWIGFNKNPPKIIDSSIQTVRPFGAFVVAEYIVIYEG